MWQTCLSCVETHNGFKQLPLSYLTTAVVQGLCCFVSFKYQAYPTVQKVILQNISYTRFICDQIKTAVQNIVCSYVVCGIVFSGYIGSYSPKYEDQMAPEVVDFDSTLTRLWKNSLYTETCGSMGLFLLIIYLRFNRQQRFGSKEIG